MQMMASAGTAGVGSVAALTATGEGAFVYDSTNNLLKYCDGTNWISLTTGSETDPQVANVNAGNACIGTGSAVDCGDANAGTKDDITTRTASGFWQTATATTAEGWPVTTNGWYHLLTSTHNNAANYYSMQFAGSFTDSNELYYRATNSLGTTAWNKIWHGGNDGSGSGLDADTVDGLDSAQFLRSDADDTTTGNLTSNKQFIGGFGAMTTAGVTDWNDSTNARSGNGYTILLGTASNGPGPTAYFHPFSFEYNSKTGAGNMTQFAIPYSSLTSGPYLRYRYSGTWSGWTEMWTGANDGAGSGLDADTLDGISSAGFAQGTGAANHIGYWSGTNTLTYDNGQLYWDAANNRLGIGTTSPDSSIDVAGEVRVANSGAACSTATNGGAIRYQNYGMLVCDSNAWVPSGAPRVIIQDRKTNGTNGGANGVSVNTWATRELNTLVLNRGSLVSLASDQFTLPAGTYYIEWKSPIYGAAMGTRLYNVSDASVEEIGDVAYASSVTTNQYSTGQALVTLTASKTFRIEYYQNNTAVSQRLGIAFPGDGQDEIYTEVMIY